MDTNADSASADACGGMFDVYSVGLGQAMSCEQRGGSVIFSFFFIQVEQFISGIYIHIYIYTYICILLQSIASDIKLFGPMRTLYIYASCFKILLMIWNCSVP
jgi:hypothetical protein